MKKWVCVFFGCVIWLAPILGWACPLKTYVPKRGKVLSREFVPATDVVDVRFEELQRVSFFCHVGEDKISCKERVQKKTRRLFPHKEVVLRWSKSKRIVRVVFTEGKKSFVREFANAAKAAEYMKQQHKVGRRIQLKTLRSIHKPTSRVILARVGRLKTTRRQKKARIKLWLYIGKKHIAANMMKLHRELRADGLHVVRFSPTRSGKLLIVFTCP